MAHKGSINEEETASDVSGFESSFENVDFFTERY